MQAVALDPEGWEPLLQSKRHGPVRVPILALSAAEDGSSLLEIGPDQEERIAEDAAGLRPTDERNARPVRNWLRGGNGRNPSFRADHHRQLRCPVRNHNMRALIESTPVHGLVFTLSEVLAKRRSLFPMTGVLRSIQVPTLVLRGERGNVCRSATKLLLQTIPGARAAVVISGAGHMAPLEAPAAFSDAIRALFLP